MATGWSGSTTPSRPGPPTRARCRVRRTAALVLALVAALTPLLGGCSTGARAVDVNNGGQFRFVAGTPAGEVIPVAERATAPQFSGTLLSGGPFSSSALAGDVAVLNFWGS